MTDPLSLTQLLLPFAVVLVASGMMLAVMPFVARALRLQRQNYAQESVSSGYGLALWLPGALALGWEAARGVPGAGPGATALAIFGVVGLVDDVWGDRRVGGFRGHLRQFIEQKRVTTGLIKLAVGGGAALALGLWLAGDAAPVELRVLLEPAAPSTASLPPLPDLAPRPPPVWFGLLDVLAGAAVIALAANTLNLFDLRPLRALKVFVGGSVLLVAVISLPILALRWLPFPPNWGGPGEHLPPWLRTLLAVPEASNRVEIIAGLLGPTLLASALYAPLEARRRVMMGDTGANALGALLGVTACLVLPVAGQILLAAALAGLNLYAEAHSLSALIHAHPFLQRLDRWGWREASLERSKE